jgi:hypothetical protein
MIPSQAVALTSRVVNFGEAVMLHRRTPTCAGALSDAPGRFATWIQRKSCLTAGGFLDFDQLR